MRSWSEKEETDSGGEIIHASSHIHGLGVRIHVLMRAGVQAHQKVRTVGEAQLEFLAVPVFMYLQVATAARRASESHRLA